MLGVQPLSSAPFSTVPPAAAVPVTTIVANTADLASFADTTPTLEFTGTDPQSDDLTYNIQIGDSSTFADVVATYYFDGNDAITDTSTWTNDANAFDGSTATVATSPTGVTSTKTASYLKGAGTTAPLLTSTVSQVRARVFGDSTAGSGSRFYATIYSADELTEHGTTPAWGGLLGNGWSGYVTLTAPTGGWNWAAVNTLVARVYGSSNATTIARVEIEVTSNGTIDRTSNVDPGFVNTVNGADTDPFTSGQKASYTVQSTYPQTLTVTAEGTVTSGWADEGGDYTRLQSDDGDTTRLYTPSNGSTRSVLHSAATGATAIVSFTINAKIRNLNPVNSLNKLGVRISGVNYLSANITKNGTTYETISHTFALNPATGLAWTLSEVNAAELVIQKGDSIGTAVTYMTGTVNFSNELALGTYYWRVRVKDPLGTNTYTSFTTTRSFTVTAGGGTNSFTPDNQAVATTTSSPVIDQILSFTPANAAVGTQTSQPALDVVLSFTPDNQAVATTTSAPTLDQVLSFTPASMSVATLEDSPAVTLAHNIQPDSASVGTQSDEPIVQNVVTLSFTPDNANVGTTTSAPTLEQVVSFAPDAANVPTTTSVPTLDQILSFTPNSSNVATVTTEPAITQTHVFTPNGANVGTTTSQPTITVILSFSPDALNVGTTSNEPSVALTSNIVPADSNVGTVTSQPTLDIVLNFTPDNHAVPTTTSQAVITQTQEFYPDSQAVATVVSDSSATLGPVTLDLSPDNCFVPTTTTQPAITQTHVLAPASANVATTTSAPSLDITVSLTPVSMNVPTSTSDPLLQAIQDFVPNSLSVATTMTSPTVFDPNLVTPSKIRLNLTTGEVMYAINDKFLINL